MKTYELTCETENCVAHGVTITMETDAESFMCGMCGHMHTNIKEVTDAGTTPTE